MRFEMSATLNEIFSYLYLRAGSLGEFLKLFKVSLFVYTTVLYDKLERELCGDYEVGIRAVDLNLWLWSISQMRCLKLNSSMLSVI